MRRLVIRPKGTLDSDTFGWNGLTGESSFHTNIDPELRVIGKVPKPHQDLVALATAVFLADRTVSRPKAWRREIELHVPVFDVDGWSAIAGILTDALGLLSSDAWTLTFEPRRPTKGVAPATRPPVDRVLLFSGGADSLSGAIKSLAQGDRLLLMSHWDWAGHSAVQSQLVTALGKLFPGQVHHQRLWLSRRKHQIGGGTFGDEATRRTRSLLFLGLGLANTSVEPTLPLWIAENGYAALNPPLSGERRGALSTRTTHPLVLSQLRAAIESVGGTAVFDNPFAAMTKGEMFTEIAAAIGDEKAAELLGLSHSCSHVRYAQGTGFPPGTQCGICFGCLVRRAAFHAAGLADTAVYLHKAVPRSKQPPHLRTAAEREIRTVRYAGERGLSGAEILAMGLPADASIDDAVGVAQRGLSEFAAIVDIEPDLQAVE